MKKACARCLAAILVLCVLMPSARAVDGLALTDLFFAKQESPSGWVTVPGWGEKRYYAQNDSLWGNLTYESEGTGKHRPLRDGACGPTASAMAIRALYAPEELTVLLDAAKSSFAPCVCSINRQGCGYNHPRYLITSPRDLDRFLPLVIADIATGNNVFHIHGRTSARGTNMYFFASLAEAIGLDVYNTQNRDEAFEAMRQGASVFCSAASGGVFTNVGHYVFLAGFDEERVYFLDPLCRDTYKTNHASSLTNHGNGLVSITYEKYAHTNIYSYYVLTRKDRAPQE